MLKTVIYILLSDYLLMTVISVPPSVQVPERDVYSEEGQVATMRCETRGSPAPVVRWEREGGELPPQHRVQNGVLT